MDALKKHFRPEFLNRVDDIIPFESLSKEMLHQIVGIQLKRVMARLAEQHITLEVKEAAMAHLAEAGYDPSFGARPIKRAIQNHLLNELAKALLEGKVQRGTTITVDANGEDLIFR